MTALLEYLDLLQIQATQNRIYAMADPIQGKSPPASLQEIAYKIEIL